MELVT